MQAGEIEVISVTKRRPIKFNITDSGCWECTSHDKNEKGYPKIVINHKLLSISRYLYEQNFGKIPDGLLIRHKCDNPACINIDHLEIGTSKDNYKDMVDRNRRIILTGEKHGGSKLNKKQIDEIRKDNRYQYVIAEEYGINQTTVCRIKNNKIWRA